MFAEGEETNKQKMQIGKKFTFIKLVSKVEIFKKNIIYGVRWLYEYF